MIDAAIRCTGIIINTYIHYSSSSSSSDRAPGSSSPGWLNPCSTLSNASSSGRSEPDLLVSLGGGGGGGVPSKTPSISSVL